MLEAQKIGPYLGHRDQDSHPNMHWQGKVGKPGETKTSFTASKESGCVDVNTWKGM